MFKSTERWVAISLFLILSPTNHALGMTPEQLDILGKGVEKEMAEKQTEVAVNEKDELGNTRLHLSVLSVAKRNKLYPHHSDFTGYLNCDQPRASDAAALILKRADVTLLNKERLSPLQIAAAQAERFPKTYAMLQAGNIVQYWKPYIPKPANGQSYTFQEFCNAIQHPENKKRLKERSRALAKLKKYAAKKE